MKPALFAYVDFQTPIDNSSLIRQVPALSSCERVYAAPQLVVYGNAADVGVALDDDTQTVAFVTGKPGWNSKGSTQARTLTEIARALLAAFRLSGPQAFTQLANGFAAAVVDIRNQQVSIAIDRIGRLPLAYAALPGRGLCFATDARCVARAASRDPKLSPQAIFDYAFFHAIPSAETVFCNVQKLPPAGYLQWSADKTTRSLYWRPDFATDAHATMADLGKEFLVRLEAGVVASAPDQKTASFLSGGIDSSTVTGLLSRILGPGRPAYTIGFEQAGYDETEYARIAAKKFGAELRIHYVSTKEVRDCIPDLAALYDEPFGNSSAVPTLVCARIAKQDGIEKMLAGDGGDELFAGNTRYAKQRIFQAYGYVPRPLRTLAENVFAPGSWLEKTPLRKVGSYVQQARIPLPDRLESYNFLLREKIATIFAPEFLAQIDAQHPFALLREQYAGVPEAATLDRMLYLDWKFTLADNDLRKVSATCRHAGVDVFFPWLDDGVIDFSTRVPADLKMRGTKLRYFAKDALSSFLPPEIIGKSKHGFGLPFGQWLKTDAALQTQVYDLLGALRTRGVFRAEFIDHLIAEHRTGHAAYYGTMVWVLAMLEGWLQANKLSP